MKSLPNLEITKEEALGMIEEGIIPNIFNRRGRNTIESMTSPETFNGEYAIQYIKNAKSYLKTSKI